MNIFSAPHFFLFGDSGDTNTGPFGIPKDLFIVFESFFSLLLKLDNFH
jgi:hypothetical protein